MLKRFVSMVVTAAMVLTLSVPVAMADNTHGTGGGCCPTGSANFGTPMPSQAEMARAAHQEALLKAQNAQLQNQLLKAQIANAQLDLVIKGTAIVGAGIGAGVAAAKYWYDSHTQTSE